MIFKGYSKTFSTLNNVQYNLIGKFWDEMESKYNAEYLRGLGFNWTDSTIEYIIGKKDNETFEFNDATWKEVELPDDKWENVHGNTSNLGKIYSDIYKISNLKYEIETFNNDGTCEIKYIRNTILRDN